MAAEFHVERTASWGVRGVYTDKLNQIGVITYGRLEVTPMSEPVMDAYGHVVKNVIYDYHVKCEMQAMVPISHSVPPIGTQLTCNFNESGNPMIGYCTQCYIIETNQTFRKLGMVVESTRYCSSANSESEITPIQGDPTPEGSGGFEWLEA